MGEFGIMERDEADKLVREAGNAFLEEGIRMAPQVVDIINQEATKRGVDPRYVMYVFLTQPKSRGMAAGSNKDAMEVLYRLFIESPYRLPSREFSIPSTDQEAAVDDALAAVDRWAGNEFTKDLVGAFISATKRRSQELQRVYEGYGEPMSSSKARKFMLYQMGLRLRDHHHWFKDHSLAYKMLSLLFDMP